MKYKVISLTQPYASLCVTKHPDLYCGLKSWETRSYSINHKGLLLIHSSIKYGANELALMESEHYKRHQKIVEIKYETLELGEFPLPLGFIVGMVTVQEIITTQLWKRQFLFPGGGRNIRVQEEMAFGNYGPFRLAWQLSNPVRFKVPIHMKGRLSVTDQDMPEGFDPYKQ